jgi:hypothetical protein
MYRVCVCVCVSVCVFDPGNFILNGVPYLAFTFLVINTELLVKGFIFERVVGMIT